MGGTQGLRAVARPRPFQTSRALVQLRLFALDALGEGGWLKAVELEGYAPRSSKQPRALQNVLLTFSVGWG